MKIRSIYYIDEPRDRAADWFEVRVLTEPEPGEKAGHEYALTATTVKYITRWMTKTGKRYFCLGPAALLILPELDDETVLRAITDLLPNLDRLAVRIE